MSKAIRQKTPSASATGQQPGGSGKTKKPSPGRVNGARAGTPLEAMNGLPSAAASRLRQTVEELKAADAGYQLARKNAVQYMQSRRQAVFSVARHYHLDADDLQQEAYEVLLTCLRDFNPVYTRAGGEKVTVQFNTFFGNRMEGKALEMRNRDPEYQARQAHMSDMSEAEKEQFRKDPPLLVQHLDQETAMQEHLRSEAASSQRARQGDMKLKIAQDSFIEKKLNDLIAAERDDKRRAALLHVKVGGVASFEEIAYHFGVTDSRASQILNELMDAFYVQRLLDGDLKSIVYDFRKLSLQEKRAQRLLDQAIRNAPAGRAASIVEAFGGEYPELRETLASVGQAAAGGDARPAEGGPAAAAQLTAEEERQFPLQGVEWHDIAKLTTLDLNFRPGTTLEPENLPHIRQLAEQEVEKWPPLIITPEGAVIDGERRIHAAAAKGVDRLLCEVRQAATARDAQTLRICLNSRVRPLDKVELYFAISALLTLGHSQGKIAEMLGTSRPNVIVYAKVKEKASPRLRQLFEDGLIQITNASSAVDLPVPAQEEMADFIRQHGAAWGRGPQFSELYEAAAAGQIQHLAPSPMVASLPLKPEPEWSEAPAVMKAESGAVVAQAALSPAPLLAPQVANVLKKRQESLENALRDAEIWAKQREATITSQTSQIQDLKTTVESLKRELEAHTLISQADEATLANYLKEIKGFYAILERLTSASYHMEKAAGQVRGLHLSHRQIIELEQILEKIAVAENALRVSLVKNPARS